MQISPDSTLPTGGVPDAVSHARSRQRQWNGLGIYRKLATDYSNHAKHHQTRATGSTAPDATPSAPLPHRNTLIAIWKTAQQQLINYENIKWEINWAGRESGCKMKCNINVLNVWCNGEGLSCKVLETGTNCPHWHWMAAMECDGGEGVTGFIMAWSICWGWCAGVSPVIWVGTQMTGFDGPIPYGCVTISKMRNELAGFDLEIGCLCIGVFVGYMCAKHPCCTDSDCQGMCK